MTKIRGFKGYRPKPGLEREIASLPYDVMNSAEAKERSEGNKHSFLRVIKPEVDLEDGVDLYADKVYQQARKNLDEFINDGYFINDEEPSIYFYRQTWKGRSQTGIVACSSIEDYFDDVIKKHEYTRPVKEEDRIRHMATLEAHVGPVFLTYKNVSDIDVLVADYCNSNSATYDFSPDDVQHTLWAVSDAELIGKIETLFSQNVPATYIADGHHRAASSAKVGQRLKDANANHTGDEEYNYFLSVLFPDNQLEIIDYNRLIKDLNGLSKDEFLVKAKEKFEIELVGSEAYRPQNLREFGLYIDKEWYKLTAKPGTWTDDPVGILDISVLTENMIKPIFNIQDQRTSDRIDFVGGIRGLGELERRVDSGDVALAIALYPVTIQQLIDIADSGEVMPPKTTWFEPKLRSGLVIHKF